LVDEVTVAAQSVPLARYANSKKLFVILSEAKDLLSPAPTKGRSFPFGLRVRMTKMTNFLLTFPLRRL
jgi:hypothetical protein